MYGHCKTAIAIDSMNINVNITHISYKGINKYVKMGFFEKLTIKLTK